MVRTLGIPRGGADSRQKMKNKWPGPLVSDRSPWAHRIGVWQQPLWRGFWRDEHVELPPRSPVSAATLAGATHMDRRAGESLFQSMTALGGCCAVLAGRVGWPSCSQLWWEAAAPWVGCAGWRRARGERWPFFAGCAGNLPQWGGGSSLLRVLPTWDGEARVLGRRDTRGCVYVGVSVHGLCVHKASLVAQMVENLPALQEMRVGSLGPEDYIYIWVCLVCILSCYSRFFFLLYRHLF